MDNIWEYIIRVDSDLSGAIKDLLELEAINARLQNQNLENARKSREESAARKQLAEDAKQAAQAQIAAELGVSKAMENQKGIIEELRSRIKLLKQGREQADDVASINKYNSALQISQKQLNELTGATDKFKGSNGFWRDMQGWVLGALAVDRVADWTGKIFTAQSAVEGFKLSLNRLVGEQQAAQIEQQLKALIVDTPLQFEGAVKGVERLIFAYQNAGQSTQTLVKDFQAYGNVARGNEENLKGLIKALEDTGNQGKLTGQEILQFGNAGVNIIGLLAESTGKTRKEIKAMQADGTLSFDLVREALIKAGSEGGKFAGAMSVAMTTVSGRVSNFKDAVFFAMANVGDYFKESAKGIVTWGTSLIQTFFGTESQTKRTIDVVKTAVGAWVAYEVVTRASAAASVVWNGVQRAGLIIKGQAILATEAYIGMTIAETEAQIAATTAARSFNATLAANPIGLIVLAIGAAVTAYQLYSNSVESAQEEQKKFAADVASTLTPLKAEQSEFNLLTKSVLNNKLSIDERNKALDTLKEKFPEQMKGISNLKEAESNLGTVIRATNNDYVIRAKLLENEVRIKNNLAIAEKNIADKILLESQLKGASTTRTTMVVGTSGQAQVFKAESEIIKENIAVKEKAIQQAMKYNQNIAEQSERVTKQLVYNYNEEAKAAGKAGAATGKANKEKIDSIKTLALIQEKAANDALEKTRRTEQKSLELERDIAIQRINDSKASETKKSAERLKIVEKYFVDSSKLTNKYDDEEAKQQQKANEKWLKENYEMHKDVIEQAAKRMAEVQKLNEKDYKEKQKLDEKAAKETEKLNQDKYELFDKMRILDKISHAKTSKEVVEIENEEKEKILIDTQEYYRKLLILAQLKLARAKTTFGEESTEAKVALADMILAEQDFTKISITLTEFRSAKFKDGLDKDKEEFQKAFNFIASVANGFFGIIEKGIDQSLARTTDLVEKAQLENQKQAVDIAKQGLSAIGSFVDGDIVGGVFKAVGTVINAFETVGQASERVAQARMEQAINLLNDYLEVVRKDVDEIVAYFDKVNDTYQDLAKNDPLAEFSKASLADIIGMEVERGELIQSNYEKSINAAESFKNKQLSDLENVYGKLEDKENERYRTEVDNINKKFDSEVNFINKVFELEVQKINLKYDLIEQKANQAYSAETLAITAAGSAQLEALITNETSLASVRNEFAAKRLAVEQSFPLASKAITEDMTQTEIDAINASIKARDEQFAKIQAWYNDELIFIATSEGQKRKEYTDTEKIQNQIRDNLELAALKFESAEITRNKEKQDEIIREEKYKNKQLISAQIEKDGALIGLEIGHKLILEQMETAHVAEMEKINKAYNDNIIAITRQRDADIAASFANLQSLVSAEIDAITRAMEASAAKGTDAYRAMAAELERLLALQRTINGGTLTPFTPNRNNNGDTIPFVPNIPLDIPTGFYKGTERLPNMSGRSGIDTELIRADVGERIMQTGINNQLKSFFGRDLTNNELAFRAMNSTMPMMNYEMLANLNNNTNFTDKELLSEMKSINKGLKNLKQVNVDVKNGHPTVTERSSNRMIIHA